MGRNGHTAVFLAFPLIDEKLLAVKADVDPFEAAGLTNPESTVIDGGEQCLVVQITETDETFHLLLRQHTRKPLGLAHFGEDEPARLLESHVLVVVLHSEYGMLKERQAVAIPVQEHGQIVINICLCKIVRELLKIQCRLRNLQAVGVDRTVRILCQAEFLSKKRNAIAVSWYGLNRLVQMSFVHDSFVVQGLLTGLLEAHRHLPALYKRKIYRE